MPIRKIIGLGITAVLLVALAYYVSVPVALLALAFISGAPLFSIMLAATALGAMYLNSTSGRGFDSEYNGMVEHILDVGLGDQVQVMSTIPLFIYAGYMLAEAKTADRLVRFANAMLGWIPGGLAIVTIMTCALFTVFTGASGVTTNALGGVLMPALVRNGYPKQFSMGLIAGTGSVGLLFPPALPPFIYGTVYGLTQLDKDWDTMRFAFAGIVPGIVLIGMLSAVAVTVAIMKKLPRQRFDLGELASRFARVAGTDHPVRCDHRAREGLRLARDRVADRGLRPDPRGRRPQDDHPEDDVVDQPRSARDGRRDPHHRSSQ